MSLLENLAIALFAAWCLSEVAISLINLVNRLSAPAEAEDRSSILAIWLAVMVTVFLAGITWSSRGWVTGLGNAGVLRPLLGWLGCAGLTGYRLCFVLKSGETIQL